MVCCAPDRLGRFSQFLKCLNEVTLSNKEVTLSNKEVTLSKVEIEDETKE